jgi:hypothetical protein
MTETPAAIEEYDDASQPIALADILGRAARWSLCARSTRW